MKLFHKLAFALVSLCAAGTASAELITSSFNNNTQLDSTATASVPLVHNFLLADVPFRIGIDEITSAFLTIRLTDSGGKDGGPETFEFVLDNGEFFGGSDMPNAPGPFTHTLVELGGLNGTGMLNFSVNALTGSFKFLSSKLEVQITRGVIVEEPDVPPAQVPEPLSIALMGLGLAGISLVRRRRK